MNSMLHAPDTGSRGDSRERRGTSRARSRRSGRVARVEHALFAVVLVTVGYVYLGALLTAAL